MPDDVSGAAPRAVSIEIAASDLLCCEWPCNRYLCSEAVGVGFNVAAICVINVYLPCGCRRFASFKAVISVMLALIAFAVSVAHTAAVTCRGSWSTLERPSGRVSAIPGVSFQSRVVTVIHTAISTDGGGLVMSDEIETISTVRGVDGTSREYERPAGVVDAFQVSEYSVEPMQPNRCRNLLSKEHSGPPCTEQSEEVGP